MQDLLNQPSTSRSYYDSFQQQSNTRSINTVLQSVEVVSRLELSPTDVRQLPKVPPRKVQDTKRRMKKTMILTDTPQRNTLAKEQEETNLKRKNIDTNASVTKKTQE